MVRQFPQNYDIKKDPKIFLQPTVADLDPKQKKRTPQEKLKEIIRQFNKDDRDKPPYGVFEKINWWFGQWLFGQVLIPSGRLMLVHEAGIPRLISGNNLFFRFKMMLNPFIPRGVVKDPNGKNTFDQNEPCISYAGRHVINVPPGKLGKVWIGQPGEPKLLESGSHVFDDGTLKLAPNFLIDENEEYIQHGTVHILRVPSGKIATITLNSTTYFLEHREEPYIIDSALFNLNRPSAGNLFWPANSEYIAHGDLIRLNPGANRRAVISLGSSYECYQSVSVNGAIQPHLISDPNAAYIGMLRTDINTLEFPSAAVRRQRQEANQQDDRVHYEVYNTKNSVEIGVRVSLAYSIDDPSKMLSRIAMENIEQHLETLVNGDLSKVFGQTNSSELIANMSAATDGADPSANRGFMNVQDAVTARLTEHLKEFGITLAALRLENPRIINQDLALEIASQTTHYAKAATEQATLQLRRDIAVQQAKTDQERQAIENQKDLDRTRNEAQRIAIGAEAEANGAEKMALVLQKFPQLLQLKINEAVADALAKAPSSQAQHYLINSAAGSKDKAEAMAQQNMMPGYLSYMQNSSFVNVPNPTEIGTSASNNKDQHNTRVSMPT